VLGLSACGGGAQTSGSESTARSTAGDVTTAPDRAEPEELAVVLCGGHGGAWIAVSLDDGAEQALDVEAGCDGRFPDANPAPNNPPVATLLTVSPDLEHVAAWDAPDADFIAPGEVVEQHAGYRAAGSRDAEFVDAAGVDGDGFAREITTDRQVLFNPATGDLWWQRGDRMLSSPIPPETPRDEGEGHLYAFTSDGEPMPAPFYDSPSGARRTIVTSGDGYSQDFLVGPSATMTPTCLQGAEIEASRRVPRRACGGTGRFGDDLWGDGAEIAAECSDAFAGWIDDATVACNSFNRGWDAIEIDERGRVVGTTDLTPDTEQSLRDGLVAPDGETLVFLAVDAADTVTLYATPTDGSAATGEPTRLASWQEGAPRALLGWLSGGSLRLGDAGGDRDGAPTGTRDKTGGELFAELGCGACHALAAADATGRLGPDLDHALRGRSPAQIREDVVDPDASVADGYAEGMMPADFGDVLDRQELDALVRFLVSARDRGD
jgi:hypothetical protein